MGHSLDDTEITVIHPGAVPDRAHDRKYGPADDNDQGWFSDTGKRDGGPGWSYDDND